MNGQSYSDNYCNTSHQEIAFIDSNGEALLRTDDPNCIHYINVNIVFIQDGQGEGNFTEIGNASDNLPPDYSGEDFARDMIGTANEMLANVQPQNICDGWIYKTSPFNPFYDSDWSIPEAPISGIRLNLTKVRYVANQYLFDSKSSSNLNAGLNQTNGSPEPYLKDNDDDFYNRPGELEIYYFALKGSGKGYWLTQAHSRDQVFVTIHDMQNSTGTREARVTLHEIGHALSLNHTWGFAYYNCPIEEAQPDYFGDNEVEAYCASLENPQENDGEYNVCEDYGNPDLFICKRNCAYSALCVVECHGDPDCISNCKIYQDCLSSCPDSNCEQDCMTESIAIRLSELQSENCHLTNRPNRERKKKFENCIKSKASTLFQACVNRCITCNDNANCNVYDFHQQECEDCPYYEDYDQSVCGEGLDGSTKINCYTPIIRRYSSRENDGLNDTPLNSRCDRLWLAPEDAPNTWRFSHCNEPDEISNNTMDYNSGFAFTEGQIAQMHNSIDHHYLAYLANRNCSDAPPLLEQDFGDNSCLSIDYISESNPNVWYSDSPNWSSVNDNGNMLDGNCLLRYGHPVNSTETSIFSAKVRSPEFAISPNEIAQLTFDYRLDNHQAFEQFKVYVREQQGSNSVTREVYGLKSDEYRIGQVKVDLSAYSGSTIFVLFEYTGKLSKQGQIFIDNVQVCTTTLNCPPPNVGVCVGEDAVTFNWETQANTTYTLQYTPTILPLFTPIENVLPPFTLSYNDMLSFNSCTDYQVQIKATCSDCEHNETIDSGYGDSTTFTTAGDESCSDNISNLASPTITVLYNHPLNFHCQREWIELDAGEGYSSYLWSTGEASRTLLVFDIGIYEVIVTDENGCSAVASVTTSGYFPPNQIPVIEKTNEECTHIGEAHLTIMNNSISYRIWEWEKDGVLIDTGEESVALSPLVAREPGTYSLTVSNEDYCFHTVDFVVTRADLGIQANSEPYVVKTNETWDISNTDNTITINGQVIVKPNATLTIQDGAKVEFMSSDGGIVVEAGGELDENDELIQGGKLDADKVKFQTSDCGTNDTWNGLKVLGNPTFNHNSSAQGVIKLTGVKDVEDGLIKDAQTGILVGYHNQASEVSQYFSYQSGALPNGEPIVTVIPASDMAPFIGGGQIILDGISFENNQIAIRMGQTLHTEPNLSSIKNCHFSISQTLAFPPLHLQLHHVATPFPIEANTFKGLEGLNPSFVSKERGTGIRAIESAIRIGGECPEQGNTFERLHRGVDAVSNGALLTMEITENTFDETNKGVTMSHTFNAKINRNQFTNIPVGNASHISHGILLTSAAITEVLSNDFSTTGTDNVVFKRALVIKNSEYALNNEVPNNDPPPTQPINANEVDGLDFFVEDNDFTGRFYAATQFEQENMDLGLTINCNDYTDNVYMDWYLYSDCKLPIVGECDDDETQLAYRGSWNEGNGHVWDYSGSLAELNHRNFEPDFLGTDVGDFCPDNQINLCIELESPCGGLIVHPTPPNSPVDSEDDRRYFVQQIQYKLATNDYTGAIQLMEQRQEIWTDKMLVATYLQLADYTKANQALNRIPSNTPDNLAFVNMMNAIVQHQLLANESLFHYYAGDISVNPRTNILAESILTTYFHEDYERNAAAIPQNSAKRNQQDTANTVYDFQIQPNPSNGLFTLHWKTTTAETTIQLYIYDLQGQQKGVIPLTAPNQQQSIDVSHLPVGVYYCKLGEKDYTTLVKKLVITK